MEEKEDIASKDTRLDSPKQQFHKDSEDIKARLARLEAERVEMARREIQAILDKYGVKLQGIVTLPATQIQIIPD